MVKKIIAETSLTGNGLRDWLLQRFSAVVLGVYCVVLLQFFVMHSPLNFTVVHDYFHTTWMQVLTLLALLSVFLHSWVGVWTILTDYVKSVRLRFSLQAIVILLLVIYFFWGVAILWRAV